MVNKSGLFGFEMREASPGMCAVGAAARLIQAGSKHGRRTFGIFYEDFKCMHRTSCISLQYLLINKISPCSLNSGCSSMVRRWTTDHRVVQLVGSNPPGDVFQVCFGNCSYLSFMLGQVNITDIAILCNGPNNCCQQNLKCFDKPLFSSGLFP